MPVGVGIMQTGRISVYNTNTSFFSLSPSVGSAFCNSSFSMVVNVQNTTIPFASTLVGVGSNGVSLPTGTGIIFVTSTAGFPPSGQIFIGVLNTLVSYTNTTPTSFTGCTGGTGTLIASQPVTSAPFPPQGTIYMQDLISGTILTGGTGTLSPIDQSNSRVTLTPTIPLGLYNLAVFYIGQDGNTYDIFHQFKPSQSTGVSYPVFQITTSTSISGPGTFSHTNPVTYNITVFPISGSFPSVGTVVFTGKQGTNPTVALGSGTPTVGAISFIIPGNTFTNGTAVTLVATYTDTVDGCYNSSSGTTTVNPT